MSLAAAYSMRRKKMAQGGKVVPDLYRGGEGEARADMNSGKAPTDYGPNEEFTDQFSGRIMSNDELVTRWYGRKDSEKANDPKFAHGGDVVARAMKRYSEGGMVANDTDPAADGKPAEFDDLVLRDDLESNSDGANSGDFLSNSQENEDRRDIVSRVMKKRGAGHNPRPT